MSLAHGLDPPECELSVIENMSVFVSESWKEKERRGCEVEQTRDRTTFRFVCDNKQSSPHHSKH
jgi:hypothetical protein